MDASLREELRAEVDDVWGETIRHLPLTGAVADVDRAPVEITATLRTGDREGERVSFGRGNAARSRIAAGGGVLRIDREAYPALVIRKHDKVVALERAGQPVFEVQHVDDRSHLRLICELGDMN